MNVELICQTQLEFIADRLLRVVGPCCGCCPTHYNSVSPFNFIDNIVHDIASGEDELFREACIHSTAQKLVLEQPSAGHGPIPVTMTVRDGTDGGVPH